MRRSGRGSARRFGPVSADVERFVTEPWQFNDTAEVSEETVNKPQADGESQIRFTLLQNTLCGLVFF